MRILLNILLLLAVTSLTADRALCRGKTIVVKEIEFRGLENLSKYELFRNVKTEAVSGGISLDINALEESLASNPLIVSHAVELNDKRLVIGVVEKKLLIPVVLKAKEESLLYLLDHEFRQVARNRLYSVHGPVLVIEEKPGKSGMSDSIKNILRALNRLKIRKKDLFSQISEITIKRDRTADVIMKGRRTRFGIIPDYRTLSLLECITAYLDRIDYYPERMKIIGDRVFFRPGGKN
jgi:hypothetical protein